jgi:RNA polymerase sigma-70 factor (ECF subfamily)
LSEQVRLRGPLLFKLAYKVLRRSDQAEDVCQQAVLKALQMQSDIRDPRALTAWLARVVVNESLTLRRRMQAERRSRLAKADRLDSAATGPRAEDGELREAVYAALADLPQPTQAIVVLRLMHGMSGNEVARLLGTHTSDVSRRLHAGLDQLRGSLGPMFAEATSRMKSTQGDWS